VTLEFTKMQGLGNDFVVVEGPADLTPEQVAWLCDRRFGVGADGLLVLTPGETVVMDYRNADGSPAEMCGNGLRCAARYAYDAGWVEGPEFVVETPVGPRRVVVGEGEIEVELGPIRVTGDAEQAGYRLRLVDVGNPHAVAFVDDPDAVDIGKAGPEVQAAFPGGVNVEFVRVEPDSLTMRVWERGVGETLACGTGMAAVVAAAGMTDGRRVPVRVPGGVGAVTIRDGIAWLAGPADYSFTGSVAGR
jgi:diaminopimelate epimerase